MWLKTCCDDLTGRSKHPKRAAACPVSVEGDIWHSPAPPVQKFPAAPRDLSVSEPPPFGLFVLFVVHAAIICLLGVTALCISTYFSLLIGGASAVSSYATAILDLLEFIFLYGVNMV